MLLEIKWVYADVNNKQEREIGANDFTPIHKNTLRPKYPVTHGPQNATDERSNCAKKFPKCTKYTQSYHN